MPCALLLCPIVCHCRPSREAPKQSIATGSHPAASLFTKGAQEDPQRCDSGMPTLASSRVKSGVLYVLSSKTACWILFSAGAAGKRRPIISCRSMAPNGLRIGPGILLKACKLMLFTKYLYKAMIGGRFFLLCRDKNQKTAKCLTSRRNDTPSGK